MPLRAREFHKITFGPSGASATGILLAPYNLSIAIEPDIELSIGRFSCGVMAVLVVTAVPGAVQSFACGAFCEVSPTTRILVGGEAVDASALERIRTYISQRGPEMEWTPDIFDSLGLY